VFLADYFVNPIFRREILRVLNRGEATNALKRLIVSTPASPLDKMGAGTMGITWREHPLGLD
jgi:hypothetical protein